MKIQCVQVVIVLNLNIITQIESMEQQKQNFISIYIENRQQIRELPLISKMLPLTQKSTKKLELKNIQKLNDKKQFDLQLQERQIYSHIKKIRLNTEQLKNQYNQQQKISNPQKEQQINAFIQEFKLQNTKVFDQLNQLEQTYQRDIQRLTQGIKELNVIQNNNRFEDNSISEIDELDEQTQRVELQEKQESFTQIQFKNQQQKLNHLYSKIGQIDKKIKQIGGGKGKWLQSDHKQFLKIYTIGKGNQTKVIKQCVNMLGMNSNQIMEHFQHYQTYLQYQKQKKNIAAEYRILKQEKEKKIKQQKLDQEKRLKQIKLKKQHDQLIQRQKKKKEIQMYKLKKLKDDMQADQSKLNQIKQKNEAKQIKRTQSLVKNKKKIQQYKRSKDQLKKNSEINEPKMKDTNNLPKLPKIPKMNNNK